MFRTDEIGAVLFADDMPTGLGECLRLILGCPHRHLARGLTAIHKVQHPADLVRRKIAPQRQPNIAVTREIAERQRRHEHLLVVAHITVVGIPCRQTDVEPRVGAHDLLVHRPDFFQLAVRRGEQRVQQPQPDVLFVGCHDPTPFQFKNTRTISRESQERPFGALPLSYGGVTYFNAPDGIRTRDFHLTRVCMLKPLGADERIRFTIFSFSKQQTVIGSAIPRVAVAPKGHSVSVHAQECPFGATATRKSDLVRASRLSGRTITEALSVEL
jgi:hypothetical protein